MAQKLTNRCHRPFREGESVRLSFLLNSATESMYVLGLPQKPINGEWLDTLEKYCDKYCDRKAIECDKNVKAILYTGK
jgi:hypothetical protein